MNADQDQRNSGYGLPLAGLVVTLLGAILFSTKAIIVKKAFHDTKVDALSLLTVRMLCSLPFYVAMAFFSQTRKQRLSLRRSEWIWMLVVGLMGYYVSSYLDFEGLQYISAGLERLILYLYPSFAVIISAVVFKDRIKLKQWIALLLTYIGIAIAYAGQLKVDTATPGFFLGSWLIFACAITYAIYIVGSGRLVQVAGPAKFTAWSMLAATAGVLIHYLLAGNFSLMHSGTAYLGYGALLAIFATVIPSFLLAYGMKRIGANNVAIVSGIGPVSTILQAHWVLGEAIFPAQIFGTVLVVAGVLLIGWKSRHPETPPE